jgi:hypothetical protein
MHLREHAPKRRNEEQEIDLGGDTGTSSDDNIEDETFVDPNVYRVKHNGKGLAMDDDDEDEDEEEALGGQERDEDDDPMDDDDDDGTCRLKVVKPIYMFPNKLVKYNGTGMPKKLQKLRDKDPYASERTATDRRFWATFQQDYYATVIIKKPKITHMAQYVDWTYMESKNDPIFTKLSTACGRQRLKELMGFRHDWNREIITHFYATVHVGHIESQRNMIRITNGNKHAIRFSQFLTLFGLGADDKDYPKLHNGGLLSQRLCISCILGIRGLMLVT